MAKAITGKNLLRLLSKMGCTVLRQRGSHVIVRCGKCTTTVPAHSGDTLRTGLRNQIEADLEPCLGKGWLSE